MLWKDKQIAADKCFMKAGCINQWSILVINVALIHIAMKDYVTITFFKFESTYMY